MFDAEMSKFPRKYLIDLYFDTEDTAREPLFDTMTLNDDICNKSSSKVKFNGRFGKLFQFCVQNCPWMLNLVKYEGRYDEKTKGEKKTIGQNSVKL